MPPGVGVESDIHDKRGWWPIMFRALVFISCIALSGQAYAFAVPCYPPQCTPAPESGETGQTGNSGGTQGGTAGQTAGSEAGNGGGTTTTTEKVKYRKDGTIKKRKTTTTTTR
ncbi:MAG: hypothetical protein IPG66_00935 [Hydrogenophilales bacterium]|nr:hypothetical protein [Hydrogenophilales bacterium]